ncbi:GTP cyclohydrolase III (methanopterin) [Myxococcus hansupus]|uniref:GTP cyclohydrolase III (Methanopterin) n=1 Tax=Pseudomyxococcus hansupus TaxID=1297742 RepID=A0A0H4X9Y4_9BACT|nr:GTP cyclohydrolase III (methanopterin) [Myxococcus hansupus]
MLGLGGAGLAVYRGHAEKRAEVEARIEARQQPVLMPAPGTPPRGLPVVSATGTERGKAPRGHVDGVGLRSLLIHRKFDDLTMAVEQLQWGMEADPRNEHWMTDGMAALGNGEPDSTELLDAWVKASPDSFAPYTARGTHWVTVGYLRRGTKYTKATADEELAGMREAFERAMPDLQRAWRLQPKAITVARPLLHVALALGDSEARERVLARAVEQCPTCVDILAVYLHGLAPRWGGSHEAMDAFAEAQTRTRPELGFLRGFSDYDRARDRRVQSENTQIHELLTRALSAGDYWEFRLARAAQLRRAQALDEALAEVNQAVALRPARASVYFERARIHFASEKWGPAGEDLLHALRMDAMDSGGRDLQPQVVQGLIYAASQALKAGQREEALVLLELAGQLAPGDRQVTQWRAQAVAAPIQAAAQGDAAPAESTDDFRVVQQRDYALARERRFAEILPLWDAFLARNPEHGLAYFERSGTHYHLRNLEAALADLKKACEFGVNEGCSRARQLERARPTAR